MNFFRVRARFSTLLFVLSVALIGACGKDASIQLTKPDPVVIKTKRVFFKMEAPDAGKVGADLLLPTGSSSLEAAGQTALDFPVGGTLGVQLRVDVGSKIDWNVTPGGIATYDKAKQYLEVKNIQDETQISIVVKKSKSTKRLVVRLASPDYAKIEAKLVLPTSASDIDSTTQTVLEFPAGGDFGVQLKVDNDALVEWNVPGAVASYDNDKKYLEVKNVQDDTQVLFVVKKPQSAKKQISVRLTSPDYAKVNAELILPTGSLSIDSSTQTALDFPAGGNFGIQLKIDNDALVEWNVPGAVASYDTNKKYLEVKNVQADAHVSLLIRKKPPAEVIPMKRVYLKIETPHKGKIYADVTGLKDPLIYSGQGERVIDLPSGTDLKVALTLPRNWDVERWELSGSADYNDPGTDRNIEVRQLPNNLHVTVRLRRAATVTLKVRTAGTGYTFGVPGSGRLDWEATQPDGQGFRTSTREFSDTWTGVKTIEEATSVQNSYPYGSKIKVSYTFTDSNNDRHQYSGTFILDEDKTLDVDFHKVLDVDFSKKPNLYEILGINPNAPQGTDTNSSENRK